MIPLNVKGVVPCIWLLIISSYMYVFLDLMEALSCECYCDDRDKQQKVIISFVCSIEITINYDTFYNNRQRAHS